MREFSVVEHQYGSTVNNRPQNGSRGLIAEPVAVLVPAWPAQPALTLCGMLSGFPHLFYTIFKDVSTCSITCKKSQFCATEVTEFECYLCLTLTSGRKAVSTADQSSHRHHIGMLNPVMSLLLCDSFETAQLQLVRDVCLCVIYW